MRHHIKKAKELAMVLDEPEQANKIQALANEWLERHGFARGEPEDQDGQK